MTGPSFFKILLNPSSPHLELPHAFVSKHEQIIPKDAIIRCKNGGYFWQVKTEKFGENYYFTNGWNNVVKDVNLGATDFLVFRLVDKLTFKMVVYSPNGVEKEFPLQLINVEDGNDEDEDDNEDDKDDDYEEDDDDNEDDKDEDDNEDDEMDGDPLFTTVITTTNNYILRLPRKFVELAGFDDKRTTIMLKNCDGNEWKIGLRLDTIAKGRYCLSSGWQKFSRIHNLSKGDKCVFKFIKTEDKLCLVTVNGKNRSSDETVVKRGSGRGRPPKHSY